jgi:hypothetical protein
MFKQHEQEHKRGHKIDKINFFGISIVPIYGQTNIGIEAF